MVYLPEIGRKEFAILGVLGEHGTPLGAAIIARELTAHGIELTERAVRYHLQALDKAGLTESLGRSGRRLTEAGRLELANARVADKVALTFARIETLAYQTTFDVTEGSGKVAINISLFRQSDLDAALRLMRPAFRSRYSTGDLVAYFQPGQRVAGQVVPRGMVGLGTVSSVTLIGVLLHQGIPVHSQFGGLLEVARHEPVRFTDVIQYGGTSVDPVEVFIRSRTSSVTQAVATGSGKIGAGFRTCPAAAREHIMRLVDDMAAWRLRGVLAIGAESRSLLEMQVDVGRVALVSCAGLNPVAVAEEAGVSTASHAMAMMLHYKDLEPIGG